MNAIYARIIWIAPIAFVLAQIPSPPAQAQPLSPCAGMTVLEFQSCKDAFQRLTQDADAFKGNVVMLTTEGDTWSVRYDRIPGPQDADSQIRCATLENLLVLAEGHPTRITYTSRDRVRNIEIPSLGFEGTAIPGRVNELIIDGSHRRHIAAEQGATSGEALEVKFLLKQEYEAWARKTINQKC